MKRLFNTSLLMLTCLAMTTVFTACDPENRTTIDEDEKNLTFLCGSETIANGNTFTSSKFDKALLEMMGTYRFTPDISLVGDCDGKIIVEVKSLNETKIEVCAFNSCQITLPTWDWTTSIKGDITASQELPLDIHYSVPTDVNTPQVFHAEALITAYYEGYEEKAVSFKLVMTYEFKVE